MTSTVALIVAAGRAERFGGGVPKQYLPLPRPPGALTAAAGRAGGFGGGVPKHSLPLAGRPVLRHSIETFLAHPAVDAVRAVIQPEHRALYDAATSGLALLPPVDGGADRQRSVLNGLESLRELAPARVLIHDAARPLVDAPLIGRTLAALNGAAGAVAAGPVPDPLKR